MFVGIKQNIMNTKFFQSILIFIIAVCAAVIVILTIINCDYFCLMTNSYFIPFFVIIGFSAISGIACFAFYKLWYEMFIK